MNELLINEAWVLCCKISIALENDIFTTAYNRQIIQPDTKFSSYAKKLCRVYALAYDRYNRRLALYFD